MNQPNYSTMPEHFMLCFHAACEQAESCLHHLAARSGRQQDELVTAVNPARCGGTSCRHYMPNHTVCVAYGMQDAFHEVKADDITGLRNTLIRNFGNGSYYLRRNGKYPIPPAEQRYIAGVFRRYGYQVSFDRTEEDTQWW